MGLLRDLWYGPFSKESAMLNISDTRDMLERLLAVQERQALSSAEFEQAARRLASLYLDTLAEYSSNLLQLWMLLRGLSNLASTTSVRKLVFMPGSTVELPLDPKQQLGLLARGILQYADTLRGCGREPNLDRLDVNLQQQIRQDAQL
jgi:hypothetical protein